MANLAIFDTPLLRHFGKRPMGTVIETGEAKTRLSELLARVEAGEEITIARSEVPVARLVPVVRHDNADAAVADILAVRARLGTTMADELTAWRNEGRR